MSKSVLGHRSLTAASWAFASEGDTLEEIAEKIAIPRANVRVLLGYRRGRFWPRKPGRYLVDRDGALHPCASSSFEAVAAVTIRAIERADSSPKDRKPATAKKSIKAGSSATAARPLKGSGALRQESAPVVSPEDCNPRAGSSPALADQSDESTAAEVAAADPNGVREGRAPAEFNGAAAAGSLSPGGARPSHDASEALADHAEQPVAPLPFVRDGMPVQRRCSGCARWAASPCARSWCPLRPAEIARG